MVKKTHVIDPADNVGIAVIDLPAGEELSVETDGEHSVTLTEDVDYGHKFALRTIHRGESIIKYGEEIGEASTDIDPGEHVHVHNVESRRGRGDLSEIGARNEPGAGEEKEPDGAANDDGGDEQ
ncbi:MAG: UxaA family hydrolase [Halodesulfurarchaeum sp.]